MYATPTHPTFEHAGYAAADSIDFNARHGRTLQARGASEGLAVIWTGLRRLFLHHGEGDRRGWAADAEPATCRD